MARPRNTSDSHVVSVSNAEEKIYLVLETSSRSGTAKVIRQGRDLPTLMNVSPVEGPKFYYVLGENIADGKQGSDLGKEIGVVPGSMSDGYRVFRNFLFIDKHPHYKVVFGYVKNKIEEISKVLESKRLRLVSGKTEIYTLLSMYLVLQMALLAFAAFQGSTCSTLWVKKTVSCTATVATVCRIWKLSLDISEVDEAMDGDTKEYRTYVTFANAIERRGPAFKFSADVASKQLEGQNDVEKEDASDSDGKKKLEELHRWMRLVLKLQLPFPRFITRCIGCLVLCGVGIVFYISQSLGCIVYRE